jgi:hypothetical protein
MEIHLIARWIETPADRLSDGNASNLGMRRNRGSDSGHRNAREISFEGS